MRGKVIIRFLLVGCSLLYLSGCRNRSPETEPFLYAPISSSKIWIPTEEEVIKEERVVAPQPIKLPTEEMIMALGDLVDIALYNNPNTTISWYEARSAAAAYAISRAPFYPDINFDADIETLRTGSGLEGDDDLLIEKETSFGPLLSLDYVLFDFGKRVSESEKMLQTLQNVNYQHNETLQMVIQQVADSYYQYLYEQANLEAMLQNLQDAQETLDAAQMKLEWGVVDVSDMLQARTQFLQTQVTVVGQNGIVKNAFVDLLNELGLESDMQFRVTGFPEKTQLEEVSYDPQLLLLEAKRARPTLAAAKTDVLSKEAALANARAQPRPNITLSANGGERWYTDGQQDNGNYSVQIAFSVPLFAGFLYRNQIRQAEENLERARYELQSEELDVSKGVMSYYNNFSAAQQEIYYTRLFLESAQEEFHVVLSNYERGTNTILDVLSAQSSLADARAKYIFAKRNLYVSFVNLSFAVGTLTRSEVEKYEEN